MTSTNSRVVTKLKEIWYSPSDQYTILKILVALPIGLLLGVGYYYAGVHRLQLRREVDLVVGTGVVSGVAVGWAMSQQVRATSLLIIPTMFTKEGRLWLTTYSYTLILEGPVENLITNTQEILRGISCSLTFVAETKAEKVKLLKGPLEIFGAKMDRDVSSMDRKSKGLFLQVSPNQFKKSDDELTLEEAMYISDAATEEDADAADKDLAAASDDRVVGHRKTSEEISSHMQENCKEMNKEAVNKCKAKIQTVQDRCVNEKQEIFQSVDFAVPNGCDFSPDDSECDQMASKGDVDVECDASNRGADLGNALEDYENVVSSNEAGVAEEVKFSVEETTYDRKVNQTSREDVAKGVQQKFDVNRRRVEFVATAIRRLLAFSFLLVVRRAWKYNFNYRTDIQFDNIYVTAYFRKIDQRRASKNTKVLLPLRPIEKKQIILLNSPKLVAAEKKSLLKNLIMWVLRLTVTSLIILMDYILHEVLTIIRTHAKLEIKKNTFSILEVYVDGTGGVSDSIRDMVAGMNYTYMSNETITNEVCLPMPTMLPTLLIRNIYLIFGAQLVMAFFEAYGLRMRRFIASIFYHKREKKRILYLYNDMQKRRKVNLHHARQQVRNKALEHLLEVEGSFKLLPCLKPSQKKKRCIVCDAKLKGNEMQICPKDKCHLFYCQECWQDIKGYCLGCTSPTELDQVLSNLVLQEKKS